MCVWSSFSFSSTIQTFSTLFIFISGTKASEGFKEESNPSNTFYPSLHSSLFKLAIFFPPISSKDMAIRFTFTPNNVCTKLKLENITLLLNLLLSRAGHHHTHTHTQSGKMILFFLFFLDQPEKNISHPIRKQ